MALDYSLHPTWSTPTKRTPSLPALPAIGGEQALALGATSATIVGPCEICLVPGEKVRLDIRPLSDVANLNGATAFLVLPAGSPTWFYVPAGSWKMKAAAA